MTLVDRWTGIESGLDPNWGEAHLVVTIDDESRVDRAAALLAPGNPGRSGRALRFSVARRGGGVGPEGARRLLRRLDSERIGGRLELVAATESPAEPEIARRTLAATWDAGQALLPADWSDLYCELELTSTDHLERVALLAAPLNPTRYEGALGYRFRCSHTFGYGTSPGMVRRCLERLDDEGIPADVRIVHALSNTHPVSTQGPVWHLGGKTI